MNSASNEYRQRREKVGGGRELCPKQVNVIIIFLTLQRNEEHFQAR